jgi:hypothetical protein
MSKCINCLMITGKDDDRYKFVDISVLNFKKQTYQNKKLLILNHGNKKLNINDKDIVEININNSFITLGDMRNYALTLVPYNSLWITWDDDDWRSDNYLEILYNELYNGNYEAVFIKNRIDYNLNNLFSYECSFKNGMPIFLSKKIENINYLSLNSLEDVNLQDDLKKKNKKIKIIDNDPKLYIRTLHTNNTSLYVDNNKKDIVNYADQSNYKEYNINKTNKEYSDLIIKQYFYFFLKNNNE